MPIPLQRVTLLCRRAQPNAPVASYWLRRVLDEGRRRDQTSPSCKGCRGRSLRCVTSPSVARPAVQRRDVKASRPMWLEAKSFGLSLGLTLSGLGLDLGLMASGLIEIGLVASNIYSAHDIN